MADNLPFVLAESLDSIRRGELTPEQCLARYPDYRAELAALLAAASRLERAPNVRPSASFRRTARARLIQQLPPRAATGPGPSPRPTAPPKPARTIPRRLSFALTFAVPALLIACLALSGLWWFAPRPPLLAAAPIVNVQSPVMDQAAPLNAPMLVEAYGQHPAGVTRIELYADGALISAQDSTEVSNPLALLGSWTPLSPGRHVLIARGYGSDGSYSDSSIAYVEVAPTESSIVTLNVNDLPRPEGQPPPSLNELARLTNTPLSQITAANPALAGIDPNAPLPPNATISLPRPPAPTDPAPPPAPAPRPGAPAAPTNLSVAANCASAQLAWSASADAVNGYAIYRLSPGDRNLIRIATVAAGTTTYSDFLDNRGEYRYQIAALRANDEGLSLMQSARTPEACAAEPRPAGTADLILNFDSLDTAERFEGVYCYASVNGSPYYRLPEDDFSLFAPDASGLHYDLAAQLPNSGLLALSGHPETEPVKTEANCWGRRGIESVLIGSFSGERASDVWDNRELTDAAAGGDLNLRYRIYSSPDPLDGLPVKFVLQDGTTKETSFASTADFPAPINLEISRHPVACRLLTNDFAQVICYDWLFRSSASPRLLDNIPLTLTWSYRGNLLFPPGAITGFHVSATAADRFNGAPLNWRLETDVRDPAGLQYYAWLLPVMESLPCDARVRFALVAQHGALESLASEPVFINTPACAGATTVHVSVETLTIGPSARDNDYCFGPCLPDGRLELMGLFRINGENTALWTGRETLYGEPALNRPEPQALLFGLFPQVDLSACPRYTACLEPGAYTFADQYLYVRPHANTPRQQNNTLGLNIYSGQSLTFTISIFEHDWNSRHDPFCLGAITLSPRRLSDWNALDERRTFTQNNGEASCELQLRFFGATGGR